jgi:hypothetical protein
VDDPLAGVAPPTVEDVAQDHGGGTDKKGGAQGGLHVTLSRRGVTDEMEQVGAQEGHGNRSQGQPTHQAQINRALAQVHGGTDGTHHHGGHQIARDGRRRLHTEEKNEHRRHKGAPAGTGQAHQESDDSTPQNDVRIHLSGPSPPL